MGKDTLIQTIYQDLELEIINGIYPIDSKLPSERDLAAKYNATRIAIREAIAMLTKSGLVETRPQKGIFIKDFYQDLSLDSMINVIRLSKTIDIKIMISTIKFFSSNNIESVSHKADKNISENLKKIEAAIVRKKLYDDSQILAECDYEILYEVVKACLDPLAIAITVSLKPLCVFLSKIIYTITDMKDEISEFDIIQFKALNTHSYEKAVKGMKEKIAAIEKIITKIEKIENGKIYLLPADGKKGRVFDL